MPTEREPATTPLSKDDIEDICLALPEVTKGTSWNQPAYLVRDKAFVRFREPRKDCPDPETGEPMDDVIVIHTSSAAEGASLVASELPFFTIDHFRSHPDSVLIRERDLDELDYVELGEVITDAWAGKAPKKLVKEHLG